MTLAFDCKNLALGWQEPDGRPKPLLENIDGSVDFSLLGFCMPIIGRTGIGKSTLLYAMSGMAVPLAGRISWSFPATPDISDETVTWEAGSARAFAPAMRPRSRRFGFLLQDAEMIPCFTVEENIRHALALRGISDPQDRIRRSIERMLAKDETVETHLHKYPSKLSGGMRKRMALAVAIAHDPTVLFADEPTGTLDPETSIVVLERIRAWLDEDGYRGCRAFVCVTHHPEVLKRGLGCNRVFEVATEDGAPDRPARIVEKDL